jgi:hypothetical protein
LNAGTWRFDTAIGSCFLDRATIRANCCLSRQGLAENSVRKPNPLCFIQDILSPIARHWQVDPQEPQDESHIIGVIHRLVAKQPKVNHRQSVGDGFSMLEP